MWEMYEEAGDLEVECDNECGVGPPPLFNLPPPPRPDILQDLNTCSEASSSDYEEMCEAIPVSVSIIQYLQFWLMHPSPFSVKKVLLTLL